MCSNSNNSYTWPLYEYLLHWWETEIKVIACPYTALQIHGCYINTSQIIASTVVTLKYLLTKLRKLPKKWLDLHIFYLLYYRSILSKDDALLLLALYR